MALADELAWTTVTELAARIRRKDLSPVEVMDATLARIEARNPSINALVFVDADRARAQAREAEARLARGEAVGPLHGVPTALKDLFDFEPGWPATFGGIRALKDFRPPFQCLFAERIQRAGAILVGKTNSPVFGFRGVTDNYLFGPSRNPFDLRRNTGGSSGGAGAAVADGLLTFAEGTDGGGSIRIPASWCGVYGLKPSAGRVPVVSRPNGFAAKDCFIHEGALTRSVADSALVLSVLAGRDPRDPFSIEDRPDFPAATSRDIRGWKIGFSADLDVYPVDRRVRAVVEQAVRAFEEAGAVVEPVKLGIQRDQRELSDLWCRVIIPLSVMAFQGFKEAGMDLLGEHPDDIPPELHAWVERGRRLSVVEMGKDQAMRTEIYDAIEGVLARYDLLVSPTLAALPVENGTDGNTLGPAEIEGVAVDRLIGWCMTYFFNFTGHPAATVPAGHADGLPVGMQIIGRRYADADVLAASAAFERLRPWRATYAKVEARLAQA
jgi:amidase/aspartyl-tRNA(Asn)/glutamyl-tRNA(Gln) amidotransferase subunit A